MALKDLMKKPSNLKEVLNPFLEREKISRVTRRTIDDFIEAGYILKPTVFDDASDNRKNNFMAYNIRAMNDRILLIPPSYSILDDDKGFKKGRLVSMRRLTAQDAVSGRYSPELLFIDGISRMNISNIYFGMDLQGITHTEKEYRIFTLVEDIEGILVYVNASGDEGIEVSGYSDTIKAFGNGGYAVVKVPSISKEEKQFHRIRLDRIPVSHKGSITADAYHVWFDLNTNHECPKQSFWIKYGRVVRGRERMGKEKAFDYHEAAAFHAAASFFEENKDYYVPFNPFLVPAQVLFDTYRKLSRQTLKEEAASNGSIRRRPLRKPEIEALMWLVINSDLDFRSRNAHDTYFRYFMPQNAEIKNLKYLQLSSSP